MGMKLGSLWLCSYLLGKLFERLGRASPGSLGLVDVKLAVARRALLFLQGATWGSYNVYHLLLVPAPRSVVA